MDIWQISDGSWQTQDPNTGGLVSFVAPDQTTAIADATAFFAAEATAVADAPKIVANSAKVLTDLTNAITTLETWMTANPNGAILTAAQTYVLAKMVDGLARIACGLLTSQGNA